MVMKSMSKIQDISQILMKVSESLEEVYHEIRYDIREEIMKDIEVRNTINKKLNIIYDQLTFEKCEKLVKRGLPWRIRLVNKVKCMGKTIDENRIVITFVFNNDYLNRMRKDLTLNELDMLGYRVEEKDMEGVE